MTMQNTPDPGAMMRSLKADVQRRNEAQAILDAAVEYTRRRDLYDSDSIADLIETAFRDGAVWAIDRETRHD